MRELTIEDFQPTNSEKKSLTKLVQQLTSYCLVKNAFNGDCATIQTFFAKSTNLSKPEVGIVKYIDVLDEVADHKETMLHIIGNLYSEYICKYNNHFLLLEGDAKVYDLLQAIKFEYGSDLDWLIPYPGDWHLLKNYQLCLMKPFFDAGLRDLAIASGYPAPSIQSCSNFKRTHHFLMETWESIFRYMLHTYLSSHSQSVTIQDKLLSTLGKTKMEILLLTASLALSLSN